MANNILLHIKSAIREFYDPNTDGVRDIGESGRELSEERKVLLNEIFKLVLHSDIINEETKMYLTNPYIRSSDVAREMTKKYHKEFNKGTVNNKIGYCRTKLTKILGENIIVDIVDYSNRDVSKYAERIRNANLKVCDLDKLSAFALDISHIKPSVKRVDKDRIIETFATMEPYRKSRMEEVINSLDTEAVAYIKFIATSSGVDEEDHEMHDLVQTLLSREDNEDESSEDL